MRVTQTDRLDLSWLTEEDDEFLLRLLNEPDWLRFIGDRGVRNLEDARRYVATGPNSQYTSCGFGLNRVALRETGTQVGICGLVVRDGLDHPDLGFAFLEAHRGRGYCTEACRAVLKHAREVLGLTDILAIASLDNRASHRVLEKLGFQREADARLSSRAPLLSVWSIKLVGPPTDAPPGPPPTV